ncbi:MAG TPA: GTPase Era [Ignavibacteria bacterium]|nr:GTPase Era [Ignavibacteria bacterium]HQY51721.1 GTPase Era [Ignavibacteria bacterium]HRA99526.1 GTPase Era [Ignavibacteria bacterium]
MVKKSGFVTIFGAPNAGKSTLLNALLKFNLSIVNKKVQTTRDRILGILTEEDYQIIFIDTPGTLEPKYELQKFMLREIKTSLDEADVIIHIVDAAKLNLERLKKTDEEFIEILKDKKRIIVLNKIDLMDKGKLLPMIETISKNFGYDDVVPISALNDDNLDSLKKVILEYLPESEFYFGKETLTNKSEKFFVSEIIREKILRYYHEEIPYSILVNVTEFKERSEDLVYINADIVVERETQKIIIIGKGGSGLKNLGNKSRQEIEKFLGRKVYLELFVKVRKDWRNNKRFINDNLSGDV